LLHPVVQLEQGYKNAAFASIATPAVLYVSDTAARQHQRFLYSAARLISPATPLLSPDRISIITNIKWFDMLQRDILNLSPLSPPRK